MPCHTSNITKQFFIKIDNCDEDVGNNITILGDFHPQTNEILNTFYKYAPPSIDDVFFH